MSYGKSLNHWFINHQREMPWRKTKDPYLIWVSEVMLQQTQVDTVIPYYLRFCERFPTMETLASSSLEEVLTLWRGLGYYRRAENLHKGVKKIVHEHKGCFPDSLKDLAGIPGIGAYTAGAILSIAFNQPVAAVDGNVMRILARQFAISEDIGRSKAVKVFEKLVLELMEGEPSVFNQAMMELGALICTPRNPNCPQCPVKSECQAYAQGNPEAYPVKSKKEKPAEETYVALILKKGKTYHMEKRPDQGLLANLWGFPLLEGALYEELSALGQPLSPVSHVFTHRKWLLKPVILEYTEDNIALLREVLKGEIEEFFSMEEIQQLPIGTAFLKIISQIVLKMV